MSGSARMNWLRKAALPERLPKGPHITPDRETAND
jgi:hypothetical protein